MADPRPLDPTAQPGGSPPAAPPPRGGRDLRSLILSVAIVALMVGVALLAVLSATPTDRPGPDPDRVGARPEGTDLVVAQGGPVSWDPARIGDAASAAILAQAWEGLTTLDPSAQVRPALAESWEVQDGGRRIVFRLRDGVTFSDGTPITAEDVRASWVRSLDPAGPSPLAWILGDIVGARELLAGSGTPDDVAIRAEGSTVTVDFRRPAAWFPAAAASPTLAIVPASLGAAAAGPRVPDDGLVVSGAYRPVAQDDRTIAFEANPRYWAGPPPVERITVLTDTGGRSPVEVFQSGDADYVQVGGDDATWIAYDTTLGPQLRRNDDLSVSYYGFDTSRPPFDDVRVRRAVAMAVDWDRLVALDDPRAVVATSLVPAGISGAGEGDFTPVHDPDAARAELAAAGHPGGEGLPPITMITGGGGTDEAVAEVLERELGVRVIVERMPFGDYNARLSTDPPQIFSIDWIADYPHPNDFLGLLLETGTASNTGRWSDPAYDALLEEAASTGDPVEQAAAYAAAQRMIQEQAPLIPLRYGETWALSRDGLLGANQSGLGFLRFAGLDWEDR
jgi:oligopeptide transport system substrate-binding protein